VNLSAEQFKAIRDARKEARDREASRGEKLTAVAVAMHDFERYNRDVNWPEAGLTTVDTWHRPEPGDGPLRDLCLRCEIPVSRHPSICRARFGTTLTQPD
jgi:hypothetical protein